MKSLSNHHRRGSVLIIVIWVCLGLVALTVYFANSMSSEFRAADNRAAEVSARQAVLSGTRYAAYVLSQFATNGTVPYREDYKSEELPVGDAMFWFIGRDLDQRPTTDPVFGLVDEASKINLNTAPRSMLEAVPGMTPELVDAIVSWRARSQSGGGDSTYGRLDPPRSTRAGRSSRSLDCGGLWRDARLLFGRTPTGTAPSDNENDGDSRRRATTTG